MDTFCRVIIKGGKHLITMPDGAIVPGIKMTRITQKAEDRIMGEALIKVLVTFSNDTQ